MRRGPKECVDPNDHESYNDHDSNSNHDVAKVGMQRELEMHAHHMLWDDDCINGHGGNGTPNGVSNW